MSDFVASPDLPREQAAIRAKCFHPTGTLVEFNHKEVEQSISERFEKIVRNYPDRIAVKAASGPVSYGELNRMANCIAQLLLNERGGDPEAIALWLGKDAPLMAAMLGVLKAGKFFVFLDASFPKARNASLLKDSQAALVIADPENALLAEDITAGSGSVLRFEPMDCRSSAENPYLHVPPGAIATILYTSGSTGEPKGVVCNHRDLLHRAMLRTMESRACEHDRIALLPTGTANAVTNSLFALLNGAALCPFETQKLGVVRLAKWLSEERITICAFSASLFRSFAPALTGKEFYPDLRIVRLRSETVFESDIELYKKHFPPGCKFITGLSTSETGQLTSYFLSDNIQTAADGVSIGYPVQDKQILLLDDTENEVGVGRIGEIVVRSPYLAVGYWRRPELTKAKFKEAPDGQRLCFTGDLGLRLPGGSLVHKGRKDFRVKIRGYGVEFAEVERGLISHAGIKEVVAVVRQADAADPDLVVYFTTHGRFTPTVGKLRSFLEEKLPSYMIPSDFVQLETMPLTPNGKVDRAGLPRAEGRRPHLGTAYIAARTPTEGKLVKIWIALLNTEPIGVEDNFFDLGGHSLLASRLLARIQDEFHIGVPLPALFKSPTIAALAEFIDQTEPGGSEAEDLSIERAARTEPLPLSFSQQRLWFLNQLEPESPAYNESKSVRLIGRLDVGALEQAFNQIVERHEVLRTTIVTIDGTPLQQIGASPGFHVPVVDLRTVNEAARESEAQRLIKDTIRRPFDLARDLMLRVLLVRLADEEYILLFVKHHIASDGWSSGILWHELSTLYGAFSAELPNPLPELPIQYADYAVWQREYLQGDVLERQLSYWKKQLNDLPELKLPTDRPRPAVQSDRGAKQSSVLDEELCEKLKILSRKEGVTLFMTLLAAFQTLLYRYSGQQDIVVGFPIAGRNRPELENLIGFFVNTLVLRTDLSGDPSFCELLSRVRELTFGAYAHQDVPFERLVEELQPQRSLSQSPLIQVVFAFQNLPRRDAELPGLSVSAINTDSETAKFDLRAVIVEERSALRATIEFNTDLFDASTISRMLGHFQTLLEGIVANPDQRLCDLPLLTEAEKHELLVKCNDTKRDYPKDICIHELFEAQVERTPDAVAVVFGDQQLTYRELNIRAHQLAHYLRKLGVGPESLVGICMERSLQMVIGLLGILKAGGVYVPLDPEYPKERLAFMLEDTGAPVVLTQSKLAAQLRELTTERRRETGDGRPIGEGPESGPLSAESMVHSVEIALGSVLPGPSAVGGRRSSSAPPRSPVAGLRSVFPSRPPVFSHRSVVCLDTEWEEIARQSEEGPISEVSPDQTAYIIYTSGTTGRPKGVMISHYNVTRLFRATERWFHFSADDVWTVFHSYAFDFSVWELWGALLYGGRAVVVPYWLSRSPEQFYELICREKVSVLNQTPSAFRQLIEVDRAVLNPRALALRLIIFGGEALEYQSLKPWFDRHGDERPQLVNMYGITETTVHVTYRVIKASDVKAGVGSLIGVPIADLQLYVLDPQRQLLPIGIPGELYVGGAGVGQGYLNRPELTAERFVWNPFSEGKAEKLYKTGDLVRRLSNGEIEYLGRTDEQVKIRGFRIELGEIEAVLAQHPGVKQTVVVARDEVENPKSEPHNPKSEKRLVAYIVSDETLAPSAHELRAYLKEKLPEYMIPSAFVFLDALPLTVNGKIDRKALPAPDQNRPELEDTYVAPRTVVEELIAGIWTEVLKLDKVGVGDNFFDLGGHSLLATQAVSRICQALKVELPLRALFERPTVAELAKRVEEAQGEEKTLAPPPIVPVSRDQDLPLSFSQQRLWFVDQYEPNSSLYHIRSVLRLKGSLDVWALKQSLNEILRRHESLRATFVTRQGEPVQIIAPSLSIYLDVVNLMGLPENVREQEAQRLAIEEAQRPFDLAVGPLVRSRLLRLNEHDHMLLLTMHHIVSDGWSMGVLYHELSTLYGAFLKGQPAPLEELPVQYADYAVWQRKRFQGEVLDRQLSYWKKQLEGMPAVIHLPTDYPRPAAQSCRAGRQSFVASKELTEQLKALSRKEGVTLFMTLLAVFKTLLYQSSGKTDLVVGTPVAGRNQPDIERLVGFFVNTLILRTDASGNPAFRELLRRVRDVCLEAYAHQELPYQKLVEVLHPKRDRTHRSLTRIFFAFQNVPLQSLSLPGLTVTAVRTDVGSAAYLTLFMREAEECLSGSFNYSADLFTAATISRMIESLQALLNAVAADPDLRLLDLLSVVDQSRSELLEAIHCAAEQSWNFEAAETSGLEHGDI